MKKRIISFVIILVMALGLLPTFANAYVSSGSIDGITYSDDGYGGFKITGFNSNVRYVEIPSEINGSPVTAIDDYAFYDCISLKSISIPDSITYIGSQAFLDCSNLLEIYIGSGVEYIGNGAFENCSYLNYVYIKDLEAWCNTYFYESNSNPLHEGGYLYLNNSLVTDLVVPNNIDIINSNAFSGCASITSVVIPNTVTTICSEAFYRCRNINTLDIGNGVKTIGNYAFKQCGIISLDIPDSVTSIGWQAFYGCSSLETVKIASGITEIGGYAFCDCKSIKSLNIADNITSDVLGESVFRGCEGLKDEKGFVIVKNILYDYLGEKEDVIVPNNITRISSYAFAGFIAHPGISVTSIIIPNSVRIIDDYSFYHSHLRTITIYDSIISIGNGAFEECNLLTNIYYGGTEEQYASLSNAPTATNMYYIEDIAASNSDTGEMYLTIADALSNAKTGDIITLTNDVLVSSLSIDEGITLDLNGCSLTVNNFVGYNGSAIVDNSEGKTGRLYVDKEKVVIYKNNPQLPIYDSKNGSFAFAEIRTKSSNGDDRFRLDKGDDKYTYSVSPVFGENDAARALVHDLITTYGEDSGVTVEIFVTWKSDSLTEKRSYEYNIETVKSIIRSFSGNNYSLKFRASFKWANISDAKTAKICTIVRSSTGVEIKSDAIDIVVE